MTGVQTCALPIYLLPIQYYPSCKQVLAACVVVGVVGVDVDEYGFADAWIERFDRVVYVPDLKHGLSNQN